MEYMESLSDKNLLQDQLELPVSVLFIYLITLNPSQPLKVN